MFFVTKWICGDSLLFVLSLVLSLIQIVAPGTGWEDVVQARRETEGQQVNTTWSVDRA